MKLLKKMMQVLLAVFFFGLLATNTVFANTTGGRFVDKDNRKYYVKDDHKAIYWHKIDGKTYYFGDIGEMVVGWQYLEIPGTGYRDDLFDNRPVFEIGLQEKWYYFGQDGALLEQTDKQVLEAKTSENTGKVYGEQYPLSAEKRTYYFDNNYAVKTGWIYEDGNWYYLNKLGNFGDDSYNPLPIGEVAKGWTQDFHVTIDIDRSKPAPWYYLDPTTGIMQTGWQYLGNKWYYLRSSGAMATGWYQEGTTWYYLDQPNGDMKTGWQYLGNKWYYLRSSGAMATGWYQDGSTWYYLNTSNGDMTTGWFQVNGKWYYAYSSGALAVNTTVDGYYVNYNGEWVR
ncbi:TPA: choline-binding protein CbpC [Streptococcus pneumoniae]|uniref:choline-binding protein CbpC n=1 Tax=Streptococcus pneumoniae TaxID=1313 RepID=UPI00017C16C7|nr:choline-binding protein CbpC [Streptococcus pneumoniae]ACF55634.1 choline-binding protein C [Streptococcus pneumoniae G54]EHZ61424.1 choline-binding protein F [Streptococcus pneumoniae GA47179]EHZ74710.1 cell wall binding repeat family protein [Streptococcus pneumoniae GA47794]EJG86132.1 choline-binding protein F [Streptococcus pneumoniae GA52612]MBW7478877.1 choline-binding protein CbpC [Streptococcus pneumoniae]